jgi:hypothetical protein
MENWTTHLKGFLLTLLPAASIPFKARVGEGKMAEEREGELG